MKTRKTEAEISVQGHRKRLRKRFQTSAFRGFHDYEVLEYLLTFVIPRKDTKPMAKELIKRFKSLPAVMDADHELLREIEGIGSKSAEFLSVIREAARRYSEESIIGKEIILDSPERVAEHIRAILFNHREEVFMALFLSAKNKVLGIDILAKGSIDHATIYPRKVFEAAVRYGAAALILVHNHPSGDATPSQDDINLSNKLSKICRDLDINLHDHLIIGKNNFFSFQQKGII